MNTKHGFLTMHVTADGFVSQISSTLWINDEPFHQASGPLAVENLVELALMHKLTHLWIQPEYEEADTTEEQARLESITEEGREIQANYDIKMFTNKYTKKLSSLVGRRKNPHTSNVSVIWLSQTTWHYENREQFARFIQDVESRLGVPMKGSPTSVGLRYLEKVDAKHYEHYFADPGINREQSKLLFRETAKPLIWCRQPTEEELTPRPELYLIALDKRAAYPRASLENVGIGKPVPYTGEFNSKLPGSWHVRVSGLEKLDQRLPPPVWKGWHDLATPVVKLLIAMGCQIEVIEAVVWENNAPVFKRWANELWKHRLDVDGFKLVMNNTLGFTINGLELKDSTFRPDWYAHIVGTLRALMLYNAMKVAGESGMYPIGCYIDCLYYLTPYENAVPGLVQMPESLGGYARKWCIPVTDEVRAIITDKNEQQHFNMMLNKLNTIAGVHE